MEVLEDEPVIRNVETDVVLGRVPGSGCDAKDPDLKAKFDVVLTWDGKESEVYPRQPLEHALSVIEGYEARNGYPGLRNCGPNPDSQRIEFELGKLMADITTVLALAIAEYRSSLCLQKETKDRFADLIVEIFRIRWASFFGSFNGETRRYEPYFAGLNERRSFDAAAHHYGMHELLVRFSDDVSEAVLEELLSRVINLVKRATDPEMQRALAAAPVDRLTASRVKRKNV
jgi:hypothetical protein